MDRYTEPDMPQEMKEALEEHLEAKKFYCALPPYRKREVKQSRNGIKTDNYPELFLKSWTFPQ